jgi:glycosyltransferase involved in cell wall biosynthesis
VTFTGRTERVEEYLRASDVFAFPSVYEALGLSLIEAASCGLACVGSRTGGIVDVIEDGRSGLLVAPKDAREWALALKALVQSPERRSALGARGREVALSRFDARDSLDSYRALFHEVANRRTSTTA